jgi:hypothetical protein
MSSSGMLRRAAPIRTDVSEEHRASIIRFLRSVRRMLVTANVVPSSQILVTLMLEKLSSSQMSVLTRDTRRNTTEDAILDSCLNCYADIKSCYIILLSTYSKKRYPRYGNSVQTNKQTPWPLVRK